MVKSDLISHLIRDCHDIDIYDHAISRNVDEIEAMINGK